MRALPVALALMDQARAWKHDEDLSNRLTGQAAGLPGHDGVLTIIGPQNAGKLPDCGAPAREQVTGLAEAGGRRDRHRDPDPRSRVPLRGPRSSASP
jgi:hypothetical protein